MAPFLSRRRSLERTQHLVFIQWLNHIAIDLHIPPIRCQGQCADLHAVLDNCQVFKSVVLAEHKRLDIAVGFDEHEFSVSI